MTASKRSLWRMVILVLLSILMVVSEASGSKKLVFVNFVWRHGDRSYMQTYPNDPYKDANIWKNGYGQLTNIGMKEQYELGQYLRSRYDGLLSKDYRRSEILIRSTDKDRTIMSAQCNMAGLYPPTESEMWNGSNTAWQPIPVHVVPVDEEKLLSYPIRDCPNYNRLMAKIYQTPWFLEHERNYSSFYHFIQEKTGSVEPYNFTNIWTVEDNLFCLRANNYSLPEWVTEEIFSELMYLDSLDMGLMFTDVEYKYRKQISRYQGGVLLKQIIKNFNNHTSRGSTYSAIAYSAHDTTLTALLVSIGNYDWIQPQYASCVMLELHEDGGKYFVEMYYRRGNGTITQLTYYDCEMPCPLERFIEISHDLIPEDHDKECGKQEGDSHFVCDEVLLIICVLMFVFIISYATYYVYCRGRRNRKNYNRLENNVVDF